MPRLRLRPRRGSGSCGEARRLAELPPLEAAERMLEMLESCLYRAPLRRLLALERDTVAAMETPVALAWLIAAAPRHPDASAAVHACRTGPREMRRALRDRDRLKKLVRCMRLLVHT